MIYKMKCECGCNLEVKEGKRFVHGHNWKGKTHTEKTKIKMGKAKEINWKDPTYRKKKRDGMQERYQYMRERPPEEHPFFGKHRTMEEKQKRLDTIKKRYGKLTAWNKGLSCSEITKEKIRDANKGKRMSPDTEFKKGRIPTKEERERSRKIMKETRKKIIFPFKDTKIEKKIQKFLKKLGIEFFTHQYMKIEHGYQCDILIPSMNLVIECDGCYWHKYPIGLEKDHIRTKELIEKGFKVLRLWEFEINKISINEFERRLNNESTRER